MMVTKLRLIAALGALVAAVIVVWYSAPPAATGGGSVELRSTAAPMEPATTMKSPIIATTNPARSTRVKTSRSTSSSGSV
ncbi:putative membrane protein [Mycobacterium xenopi 3993]|nr:putative membrane protein [Mycobacterium xenopi 3993]